MLNSLNALNDILTLALEGKDAGRMIGRMLAGVLIFGAVVGISKLSRRGKPR
jgi:hypothetical protein